MSLQLIGRSGTARFWCLDFMYRCLRLDDKTRYQEKSPQHSNECGMAAMIHCWTGYKYEKQQFDNVRFGWGKFENIFPIIIWSVLIWNLTQHDQQQLMDSWSSNHSDHQHERDSCIAWNSRVFLIDSYDVWSWNASEISAPRCAMKFFPLLEEQVTAALVAHGFLCSWRVAWVFVYKISKSPSVPLKVRKAFILMMCMWSSWRLCQCWRGTFKGALHILPDKKGHIYSEIEIDCHQALYCWYEVHFS